MDFAPLTDEELSNHLNAVLLEQERRSSLASIPGQVSALSATFQAGGGDIGVLRTALDTPS